MTRAAEAVVLAGVILIGCTPMSSGQPSGGGGSVWKQQGTVHTSTRRSTKLFQLIKKLEGKPTFRPTPYLSMLLGLQLTHSPADSRPPDWEMYYGTAKPRDYEAVVNAVELRTGKKVGLLILTTNTSTITSADIQKRFGAPDSISPPSPHGGPRHSYYYYKRPWGTLKLEISDGTDRLLGVVFDRDKQL